MDDLLSKLPTIPQYFKHYVDHDVDLDLTPSLACPFHNEKSGKSFSFSKNLNIWRCWGQCHCGGDVIDLHKINYHLKTREEAKASICSLYNIDVLPNLTFEREQVEVNEADIYRRRVYSMAVKLAKDTDAWIELDYILSKVPYDVKELEVFCMTHGYVFSDTSSTVSVEGKNYESTY